MYLDEFCLASGDAEDSFRLSFPAKLEMNCYSKNIYPFGIFPAKRFSRIGFSPVTIFCGGNGSGKSTLLNIIAEKLSLDRSAPFNNTPFFEDYLALCDYRFAFGKRAPSGSRIITSDDVFDFLLDIRAVNEGIDLKRDALFDEYDKARYKDTEYTLKSLDDYEEFRRHNEAKRRTKSEYTTRRLPKALAGKSNGESAFSYFTGEIKENALYLLDEPENSLSAKLQAELSGFLSDSVRFYGCQFVISTHSPFILSMKDAKIYDLDEDPVCEKHWTEIENVLQYRKLFEERKEEFR